MGITPETRSNIRTFTSKSPNGGQFNDVEGQVGTLKLNLDGSVVSSSGDLADDPDLPNIIVGLLQDVNAIVKNSGKESPFKRLTVAFAIVFRGDHRQRQDLRGQEE